MRILYIHQHFATLESASGVRSFVFSRELATAGHQVTVITSERYLPQHLKNQRQFTIGDVRVLNLKSGYTLRLNFRQRIISFLTFMVTSTYWGLRTPTDLVFATSTPLTVAFPALIIKMIKRIPFVFEVRDLWPDVPVELGFLKNPILIGLAKGFERLVYRMSDRIIGISEGICQKIPAPSAKKFSIPTGCDFRQFSLTKDTAWKQEVGIKEDMLFVLTGAIGEANAPQYLLEAAKLLKERHVKNIAIAMIGDGSAKEKVRQIQRDLQLENVYLFDPVQKKKIPHILAAADGGIILHGISPTYRETAAPNKLFDYMASGLPIIFNFEGPMKDLIVQHRAGYYVDHHCPEDLCNTLINLATNPEECRVAGDNARILAEESFDQKKMAEAFVKALTQWP